VITVVVGPGFAVELERLAPGRHVWALRLPEYETITQKYRATAGGYDFNSGITLFNDHGSPSPEAELVEIFPTIEEHHGDSEIEVLGADPTPDVRSELSAYGFGEISPSPHGFIARRDT
jgi:hypothetical protein